MRTTDISKGRNNPQSKEANKKVNKQVQRLRVYSLINGKRTTREIADIMQTELHNISGRFTEMKMEGINWIEPIGKKNGFTIYKKVVSKF